MHRLLICAFGYSSAGVAEEDELIFIRSVASWLFFTVDYLILITVIHIPMPKGILTKS